ncbi:hypothetical protein ACQZ6B_03950 [Agrobacterium vitis]
MSDSSETKNWSSSFYRVRAEAVILALVILAVTQLEINAAKIPLIGLEIVRPISKGVLVAFLYGFELYFLLAWFLRYQVDIRDLLGPTRAIESLMERLDEWALRMKEIEFPQVQRLEMMMETVGEAAQKGANIFTNPSEIPGINDSRFSAALSELRNALGQVEHGVRSARASINDEWEEKGPRLKSVHDEFAATLKKVKLELYRGNLLISVERQIVNFWVPFAFCVLVAAFSAFEAWWDIRQSYQSFMSCENCSFLYRQPEPNQWMKLGQRVCDAVAPFKPFAFCR